MSKRKKQYYVVVNGHKPGIYNKWFGEDGAADQVANFPEALYKGFYTREEAIEWLKDLGEETLSGLAPELLDLIEQSTSTQQNESPEDILKDGKVLMYVDGGVIGNPGPGGYAVIMRYKEHVKEISGGFLLTTNNRMELMACIEGLKALKYRCSVVLYSDSKYVVDSVTKGWVKRWQSNGWKKDDEHKAENADLWERLLDLCNQHDIEFRWTRGHVGDKDNEYCDQLAMKTATKPNLPADAGYENDNSQATATPLFSAKS